MYVVKDLVPGKQTFSGVFVSTARALESIESAMCYETAAEAWKLVNRQRFTMLPRFHACFRTCFHACFHAGFGIFFTRHAHLSLPSLVVCSYYS